MLLLSGKRKNCLGKITAFAWMIWLIQTPAEIVNYTSSVFLVPSNLGDDSGNSKWKTVNSVSMPARY